MVDDAMSVHQPRQAAELGAEIHELERASGDQQEIVGRI